MTFVTLKTGSRERRLEKQVPTTEPATGADGSVLIYVRCDVAITNTDVDTKSCGTRKDSLSGRANQHLARADAFTSGWLLRERQSGIISPS